MNDDMLNLPVKALMREQPDGSYRIVPEESTYVDISADTVARFLLDAFHIPYKREGRD